MNHDLQSEEGSYASHTHNHRNSGGGVGGYAQYSSQDSLPDSPYSSQSLDSQPATGQGKLNVRFDNTMGRGGGSNPTVNPPLSAKAVDHQP